MLLMKHSALIEEAKARRNLPARALRRAIREEAGMSQARCARELEVARATFSRWESGDRRPRGEHLLAYAELLGALQEISR
jgi:DNA-binding transcriptional regulator YiaG